MAQELVTLTEVSRRLNLDYRQVRDRISRQVEPAATVEIAGKKRRLYRLEQFKLSIETTVNH
jgi:hypothetical protein